MNENIKWCSIQPLTGGMYLGAEKVIGHPAEFILSFPGIGDPHINKETNEIDSCGNEYHLMKYLDNVGRRPEYKVFNRKMFQNDNDMNPEIMSSELWTKNPDVELDYSNMDLCVAVPVCSGLSTVSTGNSDLREERNCNMIWISKYALKVIQPKIYIFENAPTFMGIRGEYIRNILENIAIENGYSIDYYKTDTQYHDNCQRRKRTFIVFYKKDYAPQMGYEHIMTTVGEYFDRIPNEYKYDDTELSLEFCNCVNYYIVEFLRKLYGVNTWRNIVGSDIFKHIIKNNLWDDIQRFTETCNIGSDKHRNYMLHFIEHFKKNYSEGRSVFHALPHTLEQDGTCPAVMFKMVQGTIHPKSDRLLNLRELMHLMGLPNDFKIYGDPNKGYAQIGQNVPVRTAQFIVNEALQAYNRENDKEDKIRFRYFDNIKQQENKYLNNI